MIKNFNFLYIFFFIFIFSKSLFSYEIKFNGLQKLNISDIQAITQVDVFKPSLKKNELNSIIEDLYTSDLIFDVNLALTDKLATVNVTESKIIKNIYINNNTFIKDNIILNLLTSFENSLLNKNKISQDIDIIENIYISSGYKNIRVNASTEKVTNNTINLIFNIQEGPSSTIGNISFVGNNFFSDRYLNGIIQSETNSFFSIFSSGSNFNEELFNFDKELIVSNYRNEGFFDVNVSFELTENIFNRYNLVYFIDENIRSKISNINLDISSSSLSDNFQSIIDDFEVQLSKNNFFYSKNSIQLVLGKLDKVLEKNLINNSYFSSSININNNKIQITFVENETPLIKVNKIDITGNSITKTKTIRSNISISPGDYYFEKNIINSKQKLIAKKYINQVEINQNFSDKYVDLVFDIQENKKTGNFLLGGSFSGDTGLGAVFSIKDYNIFGTGNEIESSINLNSENALFKIIFSQTPISNS